MSLEVISNFDWSITERKIVIFIPNYDRKAYVEFGLKYIQTILPESDWIIIVGNDQIHHDFDFLKEKNVRYFSLLTGQKSPRNSCRIRNYAIKHCRSKVFFQKDPEVMVDGDFISRSVEWCGGWRAGHVLVVDEEKSKEVVRDGLDILKPYIKKRERYSKCLKHEWIGKHVQSISVDAQSLYNAKLAHDRIYESKGGLNFSTYFAYALGIETKVLKDLSGYDEDYTSYGYEDPDMFCRLMAFKYPIIPDYSCSSIHLYHPLTVDNKLWEMDDLFKKKDCSQVVRNVGRVWGEGI